MAENMWLPLDHLDTSKTTHDNGTSYGGLREVGHFSFNKDDTFVPDQSQRKYYRSPERFIDSNLNEGYETYKWRALPGPEYHDLEKVLQWVSRHPSEIEDVEFVMRRGLLSKLSMTPFTSRNGSWEIKVIYFNGKYYLSKFASTGVTPLGPQEYDQRRQREYRASKFEQISTSDEADGDPKTDVPVDNIQRYYRVLKATVSTGNVPKHSVLFSGLGDCCKPNNENVELKTYTLVKGRQIPWFVRYRWWIQSHIADTPYVVCGVLTTEGRLTEVLEMRTADLLRDYGRGRYSWDGVSFNFLTNFLQIIKDLVTADDPCALFKFESGSPVQYRFVSLEEHNLPEWYRDIMQ